MLRWLKTVLFTTRSPPIHSFDYGHIVRWWVNEINNTDKEIKELNQWDMPKKVNRILVSQINFFLDEAEKDKYNHK